MKPIYTFQVTIGTFGTVTENSLLEIIHEGLITTHFLPDINVTKLNWEYIPPTDEELKTVFHNARQSGKSLTMAGLK